MAIIIGKGCLEAIYGLMGWKGLRIDYCGFGPFSSTSTNLVIYISLLRVHVCIIH